MTTDILAAIGGLFGVTFIGILVSPHLCGLVELAARSHGAGLRAYRNTVARTWNSQPQSANAGKPQPAANDSQEERPRIGLQSLGGMW